jgi:hypothetical protein
MLIVIMLNVVAPKKISQEKVFIKLDLLKPVCCKLQHGNSARSFDVLA